MIGRYTFTLFNGSSLEDSFAEDIYHDIRDFWWYHSDNNDSRTAKLPDRLIILTKGDLLIFDRRTNRFFNNLKYLNK